MYLNYLVEQMRKRLGLNKTDDRFAQKNAVVIRWRVPPRPTVHPAPPSPPPAPKPVALIEHLLNDPGTPDLVKQEQAPSLPPQSPVVVRNFVGGGHPRGSLEYQAANALVTVAETINYYNNTVDRKVPHWQRTNTLVVWARAGVDANAYYDGQNLKFFYFGTPQTGNIFAVDAASVVSHECGHAILDSFRPDFWSTAYLEVGAFHEFFGDFSAIMHSLTHDELINRALSETGGDLSKTNIISRLAQQFGAAIAILDPNNGRDPSCLRNAVNSFTYVDPGTLPEETPDNQLAAEVHNFSRIMTGALWDIFFQIYRDLKNNHGMNPLDAVRVTRDTLSHYMLKAIENVPLNPRFFASFAKTFLWADSQINSGKYQTIINQVFVNRKILDGQVSALSAAKSPNSNNIVKVASMLNIKLSDVTVRALGQETNPLYDVELEMPINEAHLFDHHGNHLHHITTSQDEAISAAQDFIHYLHNAGMVGPDQTTPWEVREGKLVRTRTCCQL